MYDLFSKLGPDEILGLVAIVGSFVCGILGIILFIVMQCLKHRREQAKTAIKQDLLDRGLTVNEFVAVIEAGTETI